MKKFFKLQVAGLERDLLVCPLNEELSIAGFILFGDVELTSACARDLLQCAPPHDIMITAESKGIPLIHEMARQSGVNSYVVARKGCKVYMPNPISVTVNSITTKNVQTLYLGQAEIDLLKGKRVLIVDDVISTGESLKALESLVEKAGGNIVGKMAVLAEGSAAQRKDIQFLALLPMLDSEGNPLP